jgi:regulatory protein
MIRLKTYSVDEAQKALANYCAYQERCHKEVEEKLKKMQMIPQAQEIIILFLLEHDFLNEERFAKAFARGKFRIKKWGKQRIVRELKFKGISKYNMDTALKEIDEDDYINTFNDLALKRFKAIKETNKYKKKKKLADYLLYRGWESHLVYEKVHELIK